MNLHTDVLPGLAAPVLSEDLLHRLHHLNLDYLELMVSDCARPSRAGAACLPERVLESLRRASGATLQLLASSSFSLYSLGFEDQEFWRSALRMETPPIDHRYGVLSASLVHSAFSELALVHAWHVAVSRPVAARFIFGMPPTVIDGMQRVRLWQLRRIAVDYPGLLMPRWLANPCFWPEMVKFAVAGDTRRLHATQQLGHQLIAVDLQASGDKRSAVRHRQHNLLKQRLQRR